MLLVGTFTLIGCLISLWHLTSHLRHYYKPEVQRRIMAVLWMVPIYSVTSWFSLVLPKLEPAFGAIRDCYEAYVLYMHASICFIRGVCYSRVNVAIRAIFAK